MTLAEAIRLFLDSRVGLVSAKTARINADYLASLPAYFGTERAVETVTLAELRLWRKHLVERPRKTGEGRLSSHTVHGHIRVVRQFFAWLTREGVLSANPAARLEQVPIAHNIASSKMMSDADFEKLLAASAGDAPERVRDRALLWWFRQTGSRLGGAAHLTLEALELERGRATVVEKGRGGGKLRTVYLKAEALAALREWLELRAVLPLTTERVFTTVPNDAGLGGGGELKESSLYMVFHRMAKRAGVTGRFNPHAQRHALAKRMLRNGANLAAVSKVLGHADIRVTHEHYGQYEDQEAYEAHTRYA